MFRKIDGLIFEQMIGATHLSCRAPIGCNNLRLKGDRSPLPQPHKRKLRMSSIQIYAVVTPDTLGVTCNMRHTVPFFQCLYTHCILLLIIFIFSY